MFQTQLSVPEYHAIRDIVYKHTGINLTENKKSLIVARLHRLLNKYGFKTFREYGSFVEKDTTKQAVSELVNQITTTHTFFYREKAHFEFFAAQALPEILSYLRNKNSRDLRIWCSGCSTGEEAYMLAMLLMENLGAEYFRWDAGILATDISNKVLESAKQGIYTEERVEVLPENLKRKYFQKLDKNLWAVKDSVKKEVTFRRFNLMNPNFPFKEKFHIIFCRNVMIYFDRVTKQSLIKRFYDNTCPGGYLFIGHSESLDRDQCAYSYVVPAVYRKI